MSMFDFILLWMDVMLCMFNIYCSGCISCSFRKVLSNRNMSRVIYVSRNNDVLRLSCLCVVPWKEEFVGLFLVVTFTWLRFLLKFTRRSGLRLKFPLLRIFGVFASNFCHGAVAQESANPPQPLENGMRIAK